MPTAFAAPIVETGVRAVVLLDPALGPGFDGPGLARVKAPALVVGSVANDFMPFALNAQRYAGFLPSAQAIRLDRGEGHFVYLDECSAAVEAMGVPICTDRPGVIRGEVHSHLGDSVTDFFRRELAAQVPPQKP
jgi:predicted dienelactone hydrolase